MATPKRTIHGALARRKGSEKSLRLLLVEDDDLVAAGLTTILELESSTVLTIGRGLAVVEAIRSFKPDAVILDLTLPDVDGVEVFRQLRGRWPDLPVVFSTGGGRNRELTAALKSERVELLHKPYEIKELLNALRRITG